MIRFDKCIIGLLREQAIVSQWRVATTLHRTVDELGILLRQLCQWAQLSADDISGVIVGSVVPPLDGTLRAAISNYLHTEPLFVTPLMDSGIRLEVETPHELGADRLCNVVAAYAEHGGACVVVDFGTATTWEVISADGAFLGGVIAPGMEISGEALFARAAKLPRVELVAPERVIGKGTIDSMQAGLVLGYVGLVEGITRRVLGELGPAKVIATGGVGHVIARYTDVFLAVDGDLTLKGLRTAGTRCDPQKAHRSPHRANAVVCSTPDRDRSV